MPSVTYMNQSAPFWDFIAGLEQQGPQHPMFNQDNSHQTETEPQRDEDQRGPYEPFGPWGWGHQFFGGGRGMPRRGGPPHGHRQHQHEEAAPEQNTEKNAEKDEEMRDEHDNGEGPSGDLGSDHEGRPGSHGPWSAGRRGRCGRGARGDFGPRHGAGHHHGDGSRHGNHHGGRRRGWGPWGRGGPCGAMGGGLFGGMGGGPLGHDGNSFDPSTLATHLWNQFNDTFPTNNTSQSTNPTEPADHTPDADIFDTETSYVVHISLPGAKKEDVGVNWDAEKSELSIAGVIYRPGDEEFLKTLAMNERKVGPFERKVRLGTRASPAHIDADGITAKLEDGVLRVDVPKLDSDYVEIRKVDVQ